MRKIFLVITVLLFLLLVWYTKERYQTCCITNEIVKAEVIEEPVIEVKKDGPLVYDWNSGKAITNDLWAGRKSEILAGQADGKALQIIGPYFAEEGESVGLERAKSALNLLAGDIDTSKVELGTRLIEDYLESKTARFAHTEFNWNVRNDNIQEIDNVALLYFPSNSTSKIENANLNSYLNDVAEKLKTNNNSVILTGHTDNRGSENGNYKLALGRANSIKNVLVEKGISIDRITAKSSGELSPIASNDTKEGRQKNRRVELEIK